MPASRLLRRHYRLSDWRLHRIQPHDQELAIWGTFHCVFFLCFRVVIYRYSNRVSESVSAYDLRIHVFILPFCLLLIIVMIFVSK